MDYVKQALQSETSKIIFAYLVVPASEEICYYSATASLEGSTSFRAEAAVFHYSLCTKGFAAWIHIGRFYEKPRNVFSFIDEANRALTLYTELCGAC